MMDPSGVLETSNIQSALSNLYTSNCFIAHTGTGVSASSSTHADLSRDMDIACSVIADHSAYNRHTVLAALTACRQCVLNREKAWPNCVAILRRDIVAASVGWWSSEV